MVVDVGVDLLVRFKSCDWYGVGVSAGPGVDRLAQAYIDPHVVAFVAVVRSNRQVFGSILKLLLNLDLQDVFEIVVVLNELRPIDVLIKDRFDEDLGKLEARTTHECM